MNDIEWENEEFKKNEERKLDIMARRLSNSTHKRFELIESNIYSDVITIDMIIINMLKFVKIIQAEKVIFLGKIICDVKLNVQNPLVFKFGI